jgi:hypothetical protein
MTGLTRVKYLSRKMKGMCGKHSNKVLRTQTLFCHWGSPLMVLKVTGYSSYSKNLQDSSMMHAKLQWYFEREYSKNKRSIGTSQCVLRLLFLENRIQTKIHMQQHSKLMHFQEKLCEMFCYKQCYANSTIVIIWPKSNWGI